MAGNVGACADAAECACADVLKMTIWQTPAGIVDEGGFVLPSWLNFGITLMGPPANGIMHVRPCIPPDFMLYPESHVISCMEDA